MNLPNMRDAKVRTGNKINIKYDDYELTDELVLASRNIQGVKVILPNEVNVLDVTTYQNMVVTEDAVKAIEEVLA